MISFALPAGADDLARDIRGIKYSAEFARIIALPRRPIDLDRLDVLTDAMTEFLRVPGAAGGVRLWPIQALALWEIAQHRGLFGSLRVGAGKTLVSLLAATAFELGDGPVPQRAMLIVPGALKEKTERALREAAYLGWRVGNVRIETYQQIARKTGPDLLRRYAPDLVIADESHKLKNRRSATVHHLADYFVDAPQTIYVDLSGTMLNRALAEIGHRLRWALGPLRSPVPNDYPTLKAWGDALDEKSGEEEPRCTPGVLFAFTSREDWPTPPSENLELDARTAARRGWARRLRETEGVVATTGEDQIGVSLRFQCLTVQPQSKIREAIAHAQTHYETPDGYAFDSAAAAWKAERELARGFYHRFDPIPPKWWREARRQYGTCIRWLLGNNTQRLHSPVQVLGAIARGDYDETFIAQANPRPNVEWLRWQYNEELAPGESGDPPDAPRIIDRISVIEAVTRWRQVSEMHRPETVPTWLDTTTLRAVGRWGQEHVGIIWTEHVAFAQRLASEYGMPYYGAGGVDQRTQRHVEFDEAGDRTIVLSLAANREGRNLQHLQCSREMLFSSPYPMGAWIQQAIARGHRYGQQADEMAVYFLIACQADRYALDQILRDARAATELKDEEQKILIGDWLDDEEIAP